MHIPTWWSLLLCLLMLALKGSLSQSSSEIIEAVLSDGTTKLPVINTEPDNQNDPETVLVQPYNILEASCPPGYIFANKHCHKRVK